MVSAQMTVRAGMRPQTLTGSIPVSRTSITAGQRLYLGHRQVI